jgi:hypothetical protein
MLSDKELPGYLRPNPRPVSRRDRDIDRLPDRGVESSDPLGHLDPERVASSMILNGAPNLIYAQPGPVRLLHIGGDPIYLISQRPDDSLANHRHSAWIGGCNPWSPPA